MAVHLIVWKVLQRVDQLVVLTVVSMTAYWADHLVVLKAVLMAVYLVADLVGQLAVPLVVLRVV